MSVNFNGTNNLERAEAITGPDFTMMGWFRRTTVSGRHALVSCGTLNGSRAVLLYDTPNNPEGWYNTFSAAVNGVSTVAAATWYMTALTYVGESNPGVSTDGVLRVYHKVDGTGNVWVEDLSQGGLADCTLAAAFRIGGNLGGAWFLPGDAASVKIWDGVALSGAELFEEYPYRNPQTNLANVWASYHFKTGALTTDSSGNGRTLTNNGGATFVDVNPSDILGDDPINPSAATTTRTTYYNDLLP